MVVGVECDRSPDRPTRSTAVPGVVVCQPEPVPRTPIGGISFDLRPTLGKPGIGRIAFRPATGPARQVICWQGSFRGQLVREGLALQSELNLAPHHPNPDNGDGEKSKSEDHRNDLSRLDQDQRALDDQQQVDAARRHQQHDHSTRRHG